MHKLTIRIGARERMDNDTYCNRGILSILGMGIPQQFVKNVAANHRELFASPYNSVIYAGRDSILPIQSVFYTSGKKTLSVKLKFDSQSNLFTFMYTGQSTVFCTGPMFGEHVNVLDICLDNKLEWENNVKVATDAIKQLQ